MRLQREQYGKAVLVGSTLLIWSIILVLFKVYGYQSTWELWKVPTEMPPFLDFRLIPGSAESFAHGFEPTIENPYDPRERIFNYPTFWRLFFYTPITEDDTIWISVSMLVLFFLSVFLFPQKISIPAAIAMLFVLFSPAPMLLYERGNVDLIVFVICVMILFAGGYSAGLAAVLISIGAVIKMFPFFGVSILLKEPKKKFWWLFAGCFLFLVFYMALTFDSVKASWTLTMRGDGISYGTNILVTRYGESIKTILENWFTPHHSDLLLKYGPLTAALVLLFFVFILALRNVPVQEALTERNFAAFRMGASIYVGTFLLGNNWDYRLAFLVLVVPQLVEWVRSTDKTYRLLAWLSIFLVLVSCWHFWISAIPLESIFGSIQNSLKFWIIVDEIFNWMLFLSLAYLLIASTPEWFKEPFRNLLPKKFFATSTAQ